ncbi:hypothetical protein [Hymenobacter sp. PAMC 26628]|uniref:hypothetical protein n=1 Tax=Hymenobacter sp. PAMC 26628 TaxID=1484118 RepID=UPI0007703118|nr:hypothetical protein [Hymenobacter sp. PAMC 26628]AMJ66320.1 hypothetical protein AXW84_13410 [Hymenobacter sp. PAMC 26628]
MVILRAGRHYVTTPIRLTAGKDGVAIRGEAEAVVRKAPASHHAAAFEITDDNNTPDLLELDDGNLPEAGLIGHGQHNTVSNSPVQNCGSAAALEAGGDPLARPVRFAASYPFLFPSVCRCFPIF